MSNMSTELVQSIEPQLYIDPHKSVLGCLISEYERVVISSIVTTFGLDSFIKDQYGGDVDTIYNVRKVGTDPKMKYKSGDNEETYKQRGEYSHKLAEGTGTNYQKKKSEARKKYREDPRNNTVQDAYENKPLGFLGKSKGHPTDKSAELDHVISVKNIHDDRGRVLAGMSTCELADAEGNLQWTNEHLNKSMGADEIPDYIAKHPELPEDVKARMMAVYEKARGEYENKLIKAYYLDFSNPNCKKFYKEVSIAAGRRGVQMGLRQMMGFLMTDLWISVKKEIEQSNGTLEGTLEAIQEGLKNSWSNIQAHYPDLIKKFGEGVLSGVFSSITSTFTNTFFTLTENLGKMLRQAWSSLVEATSIILFNDKKQFLCDRMASAAKVLATGASMIVGIEIQSKIACKLSTLALPKELANSISSFGGILCSGLLSVSLLFYIDNGPFTKFLILANGETSRRLEEQAKKFKKYCAELARIDTAKLENEAKYVYDLSNAISNTKDQTSINEMLQITIQKMGLPSVFGQYTLDERMQDKNWVLTFG